MVSLAVSRFKPKTESKSQHMKHSSVQVSPCHFSGSSSPGDSHESPSLALFFLVSQWPGGKAALNLPICFTLVHPAALRQLCCMCGDLDVFTAQNLGIFLSLQSLWSLGEPEMLHGTGVCRAIWEQYFCSLSGTQDQTPRVVQVTLQIHQD